MKSVRSIFTKAACVLALTTVANTFTPASAQFKKQYVVANASGNNIHFVSMEGDMLVFELRLGEKLPKGTMIRILDGDNNVIFEEKTKEDAYNIRYKIVKNDLTRINFEISNKTFLLNQSFNVNSKIQETIEVTKA